ncbi:Tim44 domain-containing protein [Paracraurococcus lichenis]|uniref:Tim44 domain-containing protein n=1 Tax=Paracraurococcus lichenis TaxID=3064888 RepID=A0ABT9E242_9PROT|nr:Tim44 domain-containing protein [Paracraurococcus sp. LOR1-02]MDO9710208.1 Tim44 domain-containing protein [Paracraurococcus sp. LOR1-02]
MRRPSFLLAAFAAAALALAPALADARPGGGFSSGSRGSRTYSPPPSTQTAPGTAAPMQRSWTEPSRPNAPYAQPSPYQRPPIGQPNPAGGFFSRSPFMAGLLGGLIGTGLGGLLFGHGLFGGFTGFGSFLGLLLQIGLVVLLVRFALGWFRRRQGQPAYAGAPGGMARQAQDNIGHGPRPSYGGGGGAAAGEPIQLTPADFQAFERALLTVNEAWSRQDERAMRGVATPEMMAYFGNDLRDLASRGWKNETRDTVLEKGDLAEAWREGARDFATVAMRFSQIDVTRRVSDGAVVEGDPARRQTVTELWTFTRTQGGPWLLSAIQQTR